MIKKFLSFSLLLVSLAACASAQAIPAAQTSTPPTVPSALPVTPEIKQTLAASPTPQEPSATPTPSQPVFDPARLGDLGKLKSYVITSQYLSRNGTLSTEGGENRHSSWTLTVTNNPYQVKLTTNSKRSATADRAANDYTDDSYWLGGNIYRYSLDAKFWTIQVQEEIARYYLDPSAQVQNIKTARFVGQEEYQGVRANHFAYDLSGLQLPTPTPGRTLETVEGNIFLSIDGNYLLHYDSVGTGKFWDSNNGSSNATTYSPGVIESSYDLSLLNQVSEIALPPDLPLQVKLETDVPLPPDVVLKDIMAFPGNPSFTYDYKTGLDDDEILAFYQALQIENGWTVSTVAKDPDGVGGTVILKKDGKMLIIGLSYFEYAHQQMISFQYPPR